MHKIIWVPKVCLRSARKIWDEQKAILTLSSAAITRFPDSAEGSRHCLLVYPKSLSHLSLGYLVQLLLLYVFILWQTLCNFLTRLTSKSFRARPAVGQRIFSTAIWVVCSVTEHDVYCILVKFVGCFIVQTYLCVFSVCVTMQCKLILVSYLATFTKFWVIC